MGHEENLIIDRVYYVLSILHEIFGQLIAEDIYSAFDPFKTTIYKELSLNIKLADNSILCICEEYEYQNYELLIPKYNYIYLDSTSQSVISVDNSPHHPELSTFPHHKHYYPKENYKPAAFSGKIIDFLQEVKWKIESS